MDPRAILERMARNYRDAVSYADHGEHRVEEEKDDLVSTFTTEYSREKGLRFRFVNRSMEIDVIADARGELVQKRGLEICQPDLSEVLGIAGGCTFLTSVMVPPLLYPGFLAADSVLRAREAWWRGWEVVDDESCHVVEVDLRGMPIALLISEKRLLLRGFRLPDRPKPLGFLGATYHPELVTSSEER